VRRKFHEALSAAPEAKAMLDLILELYRVEHAAEAAGELGTAKHLERRRTASAAILERIHTWVDAELPKHRPKSPLGRSHPIRP
jgi:transposase